MSLIRSWTMILNCIRLPAKITIFYHSHYFSPYFIILIRTFFFLFEIHFFKAIYTYYFLAKTEKLFIARNRFSMTFINPLHQFQPFLYTRVVHVYKYIEHRILYFISLYFPG